jgi:hypothetical protein
VSCGCTWDQKAKCCIPFSLVEAPMTIHPPHRKLSVLALCQFAPGRQATTAVVFSCRPHIPELETHHKSHHMSHMVCARACARHRLHQWLVCCAVLIDAVCYHVCPHPGCNPKKANHALAQRGFSVSTPSGAERGGPTPSNTRLRWQREEAATDAPRLMVGLLQGNA